MHQETLEIEFHVNTVKQICQTRNPATVNQFKESFHPEFEPNQLELVIYLALYSLAETDPESFTWALHHYDHDLHLKLKAHITTYAIRELIAGGFIMGTDFSSLPGGEIIIRAHAYRTLIQQNLSTAITYLLLKEILKIG